MKKRKNFIINCVYYLFLTSVFLIITYAIIKWLLPLVFSLVVVMVLQPIISHIQKICNIRNKFFRVMITIVLYCLIIGGVLYLLLVGVIQLYFLLNNLPVYIEYIYQLVTKSQVLSFFNQYIDIFYDSMTTIINNCSTSFINYLIECITRLPSILFDIMFIIVSSLFFIIDYEVLKRMLLKICNTRQEYVIVVISCIKDTLSTLFKAYFIIFIITFVELLAGFYIIDISDALMIAFMIAIFDFFPILGVDMIFIPWIVIQAVNNQMPTALGLLVLYAIIVITKNVMEPRLLSKQMGVHPIITILGMFIGMKVMGVIGVIFVPILFMIFKRIYNVNKELENG